LVREVVDVGDGEAVMLFVLYERERELMRSKSNGSPGMDIGDFFSLRQGTKKIHNDWIGCRKVTLPR